MRPVLSVVAFVALSLGATAARAVQLEMDTVYPCTSQYKVLALGQTCGEVGAAWVAQQNAKERAAGSAKYYWQEGCTAGSVTAAVGQQITVKYATRTGAAAPVSATQATYVCVVWEPLAVDAPTFAAYFSGVFVATLSFFFTVYGIGRFLKSVGWAARV